MEASAVDEIGADELRRGAVRLAARVRRRRPRYLAVLGIVAYRAALDRLAAELGLQRGRIGATRIWVLPNPSGLNAHYQIGELTRLFAKLRAAATRPSTSSRSPRRVDGCQTREPRNSLSGIA